MKVAESLELVLADSYLLLVKTQNYHWNVVGPHFQSLHILFENQYNELFVAIDEIAEQIRQLGTVVNGTMAAFLASSAISEESASSAPGMVADLVACQARIISRINQCMSVAQSAKDDSTVDLMVRRLSAHRKAEWMLRSTLGDEGSLEILSKDEPKQVSVAEAKKVKKKTKTEKAKPAVKEKAVQPKKANSNTTKIAQKPKGKVALG